MLAASCFITHHITLDHCRSNLDLRISSLDLCRSNLMINIRPTQIQARPTQVRAETLKYSLKVITNSSSQNLEKRISHSNTSIKSLIFDSGGLLKISKFYVLPWTYIYPPQTYVYPAWTYVCLPQIYVGHVQVCPYCKMTVNNVFTLFLMV